MHYRSAGYILPIFVCLSVWALSLLHVLLLPMQPMPVLLLRALLLLLLPMHGTWRPMATTMAMATRMAMDTTMALHGTTWHSMPQHNMTRLRCRQPMGDDDHDGDRWQRR